MDAAMATGNMEEWNQRIIEAAKDNDDLKVEVFCNMAQTSLSLAESMVLLAANEEVEPAPQIGDIIPTEIMAENTDDRIQLNTGVFWLNEFNSYASCEVLYRKDYLNEINSMYDESGVYLGTEILEIGRREDEIIALIIRYDAQLGATARYAMRADDNGLDVINTMTLGRHWDIALDINAWQQGEDFGEWNKRLLYVLE